MNNTMNRGYKAYVSFKRIIDILRVKPSTHRDITDALGVDFQDISHAMRVLQAEGVIKRIRYDMGHTRKRAVFKLMKDE